ncbi:MAG: hypothetical protein ACKOPQ_04075 [Novosphingobium sp.]
MNKAFLIGTLGVTALAGAATYYVSPASKTETDVPPIHVPMDPQTVKARLESLTYKSFLRHVGETKWAHERLSQSIEKSSPDGIDFRFAFDGRQAMRIEVRLSSDSFGGTIVDVAPKIVSDDIRKSPEIHPYDLVALTTIADVVATEYFSSVLEQRRMANGNELMGEVNRHVGFSEEQWSAFDKRVRQAFYLAYTAKTENRSRATWTEETNFSEDEKPGSPEGYKPLPVSNPEASIWADEAEQRMAKSAEESSLRR